MPRFSGLRNQCMSTSCHSMTMPILAMHLIGRCNWNINCFGKWCTGTIPVPKSCVVLQFVNTVYLWSGYDQLWCKLRENWFFTVPSFFPQCPHFFSNVPTFLRALEHCSQLLNFLAEHNCWSSKTQLSVHIIRAGMVILSIHKGAVKHVS